MDSGPVTVDLLETTKGKPFRLLSIPHFLCEYLPLYLDWLTNGD